MKKSMILSSLLIFSMIFISAGDNSQSSIISISFDKTCAEWLNFTAIDYTRAIENYTDGNGTARNRSVLVQLDVPSSKCLTHNYTLIIGDKKISPSDINSFCREEEDTIICESYLDGNGDAIYEEYERCSYIDKLSGEYISNQDTPSKNIKSFKQIMDGKEINITKVSDKEKIKDKIGKFKKK